MAVVFRMMLGVIYLLRKNFVCFVFSFRCVMVVSYFKKRGVLFVNCMLWVGLFYFIYIRGF